MRLLKHLENGRSQTVVLYGTSLTAEGRWAGKLRDWLAGRYASRVVIHNSGMSGQASNTGVAKLAERVLSLSPDVVFIEFGMNDAFAAYEINHPDHGITLERSRANLDRMIDRILAERPACEVVLQTMNPSWDAPNGRMSASKRPNLGAYYDIYRQVALERGACLLDHHVNWCRLRAERQELFEIYIPDGTHPTDEGSLAVTMPVIQRALDQSR
jgi:lysophospholipase L1-like esterase